MMLLDITLSSMGLEPIGGVMMKLIEHNTIIPIKKGQHSSRVFSFGSSRTKENLLRKFHLDVISPVLFDIDTNEIWNVSAKR